MSRRLGPLLVATAGAFALLLTAPDSARAQFGKRLKDAVARNAENRAIYEVISHENKAIDVALAAALSPGDDEAGGKLYDELSSTGRVILDGVNFEPGTATMTESSAGPLKAIGAMLKSHADLAVRMEAYAPDKQVAAARADAITQSLVKAYSIDPSRIEAAGYLAKAGERVDLVQR
jgi:outer membrane protein OmpA-like peptidoglycan-associated protein